MRWHVMRELLGIDAEAALPHLKRMAARDPHPDVRRAARSVLDRLAGAPARGRPPDMPRIIACPEEERRSSSAIWSPRSTTRRFDPADEDNFAAAGPAAQAARQQSRLSSPTSRSPS